jgi:hypothetical protein
MNRRLWLRINGWLFIVLLLSVLGAAAWASSRLPHTWQWGGALARSLSAPSQRLLNSLEGEVSVHAFVQPGQLLDRHVKELLGLYAAQTPKFRMTLVNPDARPDLVREYGIERAGELVLEYRGRRERVQVPTEAHVSAALERLLRGESQFIAFLSGRGERNLLGEANHDLGAFGEALQRKGYRLQPLSLARLSRIPDNTSLLVLTPPQADLLPGEQAVLMEYVARGGNVLWLSDPAEHGRLAFLAEALGLHWRDGVLVDPNAATALAVDDPRLALIDGFPPHAATAPLRAPVLLVQAAVLDAPLQGWDVQPLLQGGVDQFVVERYRPGEAIDGAATAHGAVLAAALSRRVGDRLQRVVVAGDGDFLSNSYIGNGGNLPLGLNAVDWLTQSELFLDSFARPAPDQIVELGKWQTIGLAGGLLLVLPLGFLTLAGTRWWRRLRG